MSNTTRFQDTPIIDNVLQFWVPPQITPSVDRTYIIPREEVGRPDKISNTVYGSSDYDWLILYYNSIRNPFRDLHQGKILRIPFLENVRWIL